MSLRSLEAEILAELRTLPGFRKVRQKDIMEWSTGAVKSVEGEVQATLPFLKINVAIKKKRMGKESND